MHERQCSIAASQNTFEILAVVEDALDDYTVGLHHKYDGDSTFEANDPQARQDVVAGGVARKSEEWSTDKPVAGEAVAMPAAIAAFF